MINDLTYSSITQLGIFFVTFTSMPAILSMRESRTWLVAILAIQPRITATIAEDFITSPAGASHPAWKLTFWSIKTEWAIFIIARLAGLAQALTSDMVTAMAITITNFVATR